MLGLISQHCYFLSMIKIRGKAEYQFKTAAVILVFILDALFGFKYAK